MSVYRPLDPSELKFVLADVTVAFTATVTGPLDGTLLDAAFERLAVSEPVLRSRVVQDDRGLVMEAALARPPALEVLDGGEEDYLREVFSRPAADWAVARLLQVRAEESDTVVLVLHHAVADARFVLTLFARLWQTYTDLAEGAAVEPAIDGALPRSVESLLPERWTAGPPEREGRPDPAEPSPYDPPPVAVAPGSRPLAHRLRLSVRETERLAGLATEHGVTVHALVCAALLTAKARAGLAGDRRRLTCRTPIDLRDRVTPPVPGTAATNFISGTLAVVDLPEDGDVVAPARAIREQLREALRLGEPQRLVLDPDRTLRFVLRPCDAVVSNAGAVPDLRVPDGMTVTDVRLLINQVPGNPTFMVMSYGGRLSIEFLLASSAVTADELERFTAAVGELLTGVAAPAG